MKINKKILMIALSSIVFLGTMSFLFVPSLMDLQNEIHKLFFSIILVIWFLCCIGIAFLLFEKLMKNNRFKLKGQKIMKKLLIVVLAFSFTSLKAQIKENQYTFFEPKDSLAKIKFQDYVLEFVNGPGLEKNFKIDRLFLGNTKEDSISVFQNFKPGLIYEVFLIAGSNLGFMKVRMYHYDRDFWIPYPEEFEISIEKGNFESLTSFKAKTKYEKKVRLDFLLSADEKSLSSNYAMIVAYK